MARHAAIIQLLRIRERRVEARITRLLMMLECATAIIFIAPGPFVIGVVLAW